MAKCEVSPNDRLALGDLFAPVPKLRAVIDCVLEGHLGAAFVDDAQSPNVGWLELGCYTIFGGDSGHIAAREAVQSVSPPRELVFPDSDQWRRLLHEVHGDRVADRSMQSFSADSLRLADLRKAAKAPAGFSLVQIDAEIAAQVAEHLRPNGLEVFPSVRDFVAQGIGYATCLASEHSPRPVSAATTYAISRHSIELAIASDAAFRGQGLAFHTAAALMVHCLERDLVPHWNAFNPVSQRLAQRLGYVPDGICEILELSS